MVTAAKPTGAADFLIPCHANNWAQRDGDELQRELADFVGLEQVMCPWLLVKHNLRPGLHCSEAISWTSKTSRWVESRKLVTIYIIPTLLLLRFLLWKHCELFWFFFPLGIKNATLNQVVLLVLTLDFSAMLQLGPFHWISTLPRSSKKTSPLLKLSQESATCHREMREFGRVGRTSRAAGDKSQPWQTHPWGCKNRLAVTAHSAGTQLSLSTVASLLVNTKPSSEDLKTVLKQKFLSRNEIPTRQICSKMSVGWEGRRNDPQEEQRFLLPLWLTRASCPWREEDAWCCTCWSPRAWILKPLLLSCSCCVKNTIKS